MNPRVRYVEERDLPQLRAWDPWPRQADWDRKLGYQQALVAEDAETGDLLGFLRYEVLWCTVPFLGLIWVREDARGQGCGRALLEFLENDLRRLGYVALLSSSQTDEPEPQCWHLHMGFHTNGIIENIADDNIGEIVYRKLLDQG